MAGRSCLHLPDGRLSQVANVRKEQAIEEAMDWPRGPSQEDKVYKTVSRIGDYEVLLGKPGKEAAPTFSRINPHDMLPIVKRDGVFIDYSPSFQDIFAELQHLGRQDEESLKLMACLFVRSAFMLDHTEIESRQWRYHPPEEIVNEIESRTPHINAHTLSMGVFIHLVDALAWNEDVKYNFLFDFNAIKKGTGRRNTLLTCTHIIAVFLDRAPLVKFAMGLVRGRGVSPLSQKNCMELFPDLAREATLGG